MKKAKILNYIFTGLFLAMMAFSVISSCMNPDEAQKMVHGLLGYPIYFINFIDIAKALGIIALIVPGFPRIKEWAYAGFFFDLFAATYSSIAVNEPVSHWGAMIIFFALFACSYIFYHRKLKAAATTNS